jgi:hypothetical protein
MLYTDVPELTQVMGHLIKFSPTYFILYAFCTRFFVFEFIHVHVSPLILKFIFVYL